MTQAADRLVGFVQETMQTVYNWQFMHSLSLWTRVIGELQADESVASLIYPLTQVIIGTIKSVTHDFFLSVQSVDNHNIAFINLISTPCLEKSNPLDNVQ